MLLYGILVLVFNKFLKVVTKESDEKREKIDEKREKIDEKRKNIDEKNKKNKIKKEKIIRDEVGKTEKMF